MSHKYILKKLVFVHTYAHPPHDMGLNSHSQPTILNIKYGLTVMVSIIPLQAKRVREVANLTEGKNPHTPVYGAKERPIRRGV